MIGARGLRGLDGAERPYKGSLEVFGPPFQQVRGLGYAVRLSLHPTLELQNFACPDLGFRCLQNGK